MTLAFRGSSAAALLVALGLLPGTAQAQHRVHGQQPHHQHRVHGQQPHHHRFHHRPLGSRFGVVAPFVPFGYYSATSIVDSAPPVYYASPPVVYPAPVPYGPVPAYASPPAPMYPPPPQQPPLQQDVEPIQREVVFPSGRYVLRGDGINTPYTWVWIPNAPPAPPGGAQSSNRESERAIYTWTDASGVTTWTDRLSSVPAQYRAGARRAP